jgi:hypothetical protein
MDESHLARQSSGGRNGEKLPQGDNHVDFSLRDPPDEFDSVPAHVGAVGEQDLEGVIRESRVDFSQVVESNVDRNHVPPGTTQASTHNAVNGCDSTQGGGNTPCDFAF